MIEKKYVNTLQYIDNQLELIILYWKEDFFNLKEPMRNSAQAMKLKVAPETLNNIIFIAFHENTIGYHLTFYQTIHRI